MLFVRCKPCTSVLLSFKMSVRFVWEGSWKCCLWWCLVILSLKFLCVISLWMQGTYRTNEVFIGYNRMKIESFSWIWIRPKHPSVQRTCCRERILQRLSLLKFIIVESSSSFLIKIITGWTVWSLDKEKLRFKHR